MDKKTGEKNHFSLTLLTINFNFLFCRCKSVHFCMHKVRTLGV